MLNTSRDFRRERERSRRRAKFWLTLGRITLKLLIVVRVLTKLVELGFTVMRWLRE
jgi:hypothetical protein